MLISLQFASCLPASRNVQPVYNSGSVSNTLCCPRVYYYPVPAYSRTLQLRPRIPLAACRSVVLPCCNGLRPKKDIIFLFLYYCASLISFLISLFVFLWAFVLRFVPPFRLSAPFSLLYGLHSFFLSRFLLISISFLFLNIIFFLPVFNWCFRHHPRDDSECSELAGSWGPPIRYPAVCNSLVAQQTTEIK